MIIYISESLNSKKNGGSSTSGFEFLQFLRIKYKNLVVITNDNLQFNEDSKLFYDHVTNEIKKVIVLKRDYPVKPLTIKKIAKKVYYFLKDILKNNSCDLLKYFEDNSTENIIYVNSWSGIFNPNKLKNFENFKTVCIVRGSPESFFWQSFDEDKDKAIKDAASFLVLFDKLIFVSNNGLHAWNKIINKTSDSYYLPNSINELDVNIAKKYSTSEAKKKLLFSENNYNIVVVGSIQIRKAQDILLYVVEDLVKQYPNIRFHLVGVISDTWGGDIIYNNITTSKYKSHFKFYGHSNNQLIFMQAADLLLFTSRAEAFPRTVAEYMAIGKPIVAADVSGVNEMINHKVNGWLYNPNIPKELLDGLTAVIENTELQNKFSINAKNTYYSKFCKKNHILKAMEVFNDIETK